MSFASTFGSPATGAGLVYPIQDNTISTTTPFTLPSPNVYYNITAATASVVIRLPETASIGEWVNVIATATSGSSYQIQKGGRTDVSSNSQDALSFLYIYTSSGWVNTSNWVYWN